MGWRESAWVCGPPTFPPGHTPLPSTPPPPPPPLDSLISPPCLKDIAVRHNNSRNIKFNSKTRIRNTAFTTLYLLLIQTENLWVSMRVLDPIFGIPMDPLFPYSSFFYLYTHFMLRVVGAVSLAKLQTVLGCINESPPNLSSSHGCILQRGVGGAFYSLLFYSSKSSHAKSPFGTVPYYLSCVV